MTWTQMKMYRSLVAAAAREMGFLDNKRTETYRRAVLFEETGLKSSLELKRQSDIDAVMRRHAADANDWATAAKFCAGDAKRLAAMAADCARQIMELSGKDGAEAALYILAILRAGNLIVKDVTMNPADWWKDCPEPTVKHIFCILDKHRRRMVRRERSVHNNRVPGDTPLAYRFGASWKG